MMKQQLQLWSLIIIAIRSNPKASVVITKQTSKAYRFALRNLSLTELQRAMKVKLECLCIFSSYYHYNSIKFNSEHLQV